MKKAIGIDIGGTKIAMVLGSESGKIYARREILTQKGAQVRSCIKDVIFHLNSILAETRVKKKEVIGIGVGIPGAVNSKTGLVPRSPHMKGWQGLPLARMLSEEMKKPVWLANDANAAALGENRFGIGRNQENFIYMTISTGVGGGLICNGRLITGSAYVGGEIGHMVIVPEGNPCNCGQTGCLEACGSGTAMANYFRKQVGKGRKTKVMKMIPQGETLSAKWIGLAAQKKDALALESFRKGAYYLGIGIANLLNILNPGVVVLGGGVLKSAPGHFISDIRKSAKDHSWPEAYRAVKIMRSKLKDHVGDLGALAVAFEYAHVKK